MEQLVKFHSEGQVIQGNLSLPHKGAPCIIMSHGLEGSKDGDKWLILAHRLYEVGFGCLRFSYRGCGEGEERSEGQFEDTTLTNRIKDYIAAINFSETTTADEKRLGVIGSSFGGMVALAARNSRIKAAVTLATPIRLQAPNERRFKEHQNGQFFELSSGRRLKARFFSDVQQYDIGKSIRKLHCPVLIVHGSADEIVPVKNAQDLYKSVKEPKRLAIIEGGDHVFSDPQHVEQITVLALDWFRQHL